MMSIAFERAKSSFLEFLVSQGKSKNTIKNYTCDLKTFLEFCSEVKVDLDQMGLGTLENYHLDLKKRGLKPNSRRRKVITAKTFLRFMTGKMDMPLEGSDKWIPPEKVERPPKLVSDELVQKIASEQLLTEVGWRNKALIGVLRDTGMLVTEALALRKQDCFFDLDDEKKIVGAKVKVLGKRARTSEVSRLTALALNELQTLFPKSVYFFYGYTKGGPNPEKLTPRGVEVLFKNWAKLHGDKNLKPRVLRHLFVVEQIMSGKTQRQIMDWIGLRTSYSFRIYAPWTTLRSNSVATYMEEKNPPMETASHPKLEENKEKPLS